MELIDRLLNWAFLLINTNMKNSPWYCVSDNKNISCRPILRPIKFFLAAGPSQQRPRVEANVLNTTTTIQIKWNDAPGNKWNWIGLFDAKETDVESPLAYRYLGGAIEGTCRWDVRDQDLSLSNQLQVRMFVNDSNCMIATSIAFAAPSKQE